jgi:hypothetical protein
MATQEIADKIHACVRDEDVLGENTHQAMI